MSADRRVIACNHVAGTSALAAGAKCYVLDPNVGGGGDRVWLLARSRRGRRIEVWEDARRLAYFRGATLPPGHPLWANERLADWSAATVRMLIEASLAPLAAGTGARGE